MKIAALLISALLITGPAFAKSSVEYQPIDQDESQLVERGSYKNSDGKSVRSPAHTKSGGPPKGASASAAMVTLVSASAVEALAQDIKTWRNGSKGRDYSFSTIARH